jgi:AcrR family transcriptional regulator
MDVAIAGSGSMTTHQARDAGGVGRHMQRPGGRNERVRQSVAHAVLDLLSAGETHMTVAEIAEQAGVHRATVYRRWPSVGDLLREALTVHTATLRIRDTGHWERDLRRLVDDLARFFSDPAELAMNTAMAGGSDPLLDEVLTAHWMPVIGEIESLVRNAINRKEVVATADPATIVQLIVSPLLVQTIFLRTRPAKSFLHHLADTIIRATRP